MEGYTFLQPPINTYDLAAEAPYLRDPDSPTYTGSFGAVWRATHKSTAQIFAIKEISSDAYPRRGVTSTPIQDIKSEIELLHQCDHPNVLRLVEIYQLQTIGPNTYFLVTSPWAPITLYTFLRDLSDDGESSCCPWWDFSSADQVILQIFRGLVDGLVYLHDHAIKHKDIKPENILFHQYENATRLSAVTPIIADFGISKVHHTGRPTKFTRGTMQYLAPEQIKHVESGLKADIFSMGCCFLLLYAAAHEGGTGIGEIENVVLNNSCQYGKELNRLIPILKRFVSSTAEPGDDLHLLGIAVESMLYEDPSKRMNAQAINYMLNPSGKQNRIEDQFSDPFTLKGEISADLMQWQPIIVSLDTGAIHSFISKEFVDRHNLPFEPLESHMVVKTMNGQDIVGKSNLSWRSSSKQPSPLSTNFIVVAPDTAVSEVIFGLNEISGRNLLKRRRKMTLLMDKSIA